MKGYISTPWPKNERLERNSREDLQRGLPDSNSDLWPNVSSGFLYIPIFHLKLLVSHVFVPLTHFVCLYRPWFLLILAKMTIPFIECDTIFRFLGYEIKSLSLQTISSTFPSQLFVWCSGSKLWPWNPPSCIFLCHPALTLISTREGLVNFLISYIRCMHKWWGCHWEPLGRHEHFYELSNNQSVNCDRQLGKRVFWSSVSNPEAPHPFTSSLLGKKQPFSLCLKLLSPSCPRNTGSLLKLWQKHWFIFDMRSNFLKVLWIFPIPNSISMTCQKRAQKQQLQQTAQAG